MGQLAKHSTAGTPVDRIAPRRTPSPAALAHEAIDQHGDKTATAEERAKRKRRLLKGPSEFRNMRRDHPGKRKP